MLLRKQMGAALALSVVAVGCVGSAARADKLPVVDGPGLRELVASRRGKAVVVNFWATWCGPCKEEFPSLVKLSNAYRSKGVDVITVTLDDPPKLGAARAFLKQQKAATANYIKKPGNPAALVKAADITWPGSIPVTVVYNTNGKVAAIMRGSQTYAQFDAVVKRALKPPMVMRVSPSMLGGRRR